MANYTRFQLRGDTKANWLSVNPILAKNEPAIENDTNRFKIGDGVSTYSQLSYGRNTSEYASVYNVTSLYPLPSGFYEHSTAILAVPSGERILGLIITYETASGVWYTERFIGTDIANWGVAANWEKLPDAGDLAQLRSDLSEIKTKTNEVDSRVLGDSFILSDKDGNVIFKVDSEGIKSKKYNICDTDGNVVASVNKDWIDTIIFKNNVIDNLSSSDINSPLSANMGKFLYENLAIIFEKLSNVFDNYEFSDSFYLSDVNGNVIFKVDSEGIKSKKYNICDSNGNVLATVNKEIFQTVYADKEDSNDSGVVNNYKGQFIISDVNGNVIFKVDSEGFHSSDVNSLIYEQITPTIAKVKSSNKYQKVFFQESKLSGKTILAIGDSLTAAYKWQVKTAEILGASQVTHALGGGGLITFVDGGTNSSGTLAALNSTDVSGKDVIVILGPYNNRSLMGSIGVKTDMYPTQQTLWGQMNYIFKRIYQELTTANNLKCKIFFAGVHAYGAYPYIDKTAYQEYPPGTGYTGRDFSEKLKEICGWNGIEFIDLFNNSGINSYTWNKYQASSQPNATNYIGYINGRGAGINDPFPDLDTLNSSIVTSGFVNWDRATVVGYTGYYTFNGTSFVATPTSSFYPWISDQLHCSTEGYELIGNYIASQINKFINN